MKGKDVTCLTSAQQNAAKRGFNKTGQLSPQTTVLGLRFCMHAPLVRPHPFSPLSSITPYSASSPPYQYKWPQRPMTASLAGSKQILHSKALRSRFDPSAPPSGSPGPVPAAAIFRPHLSHGRAVGNACRTAIGLAGGLSRPTDISLEQAAINCSLRDAD